MLRRGEMAAPWGNPSMFPTLVPHGTLAIIGAICQLRRVKCMNLGLLGDRYEGSLMSWDWKTDSGPCGRGRSSIHLSPASIVLGSMGAFSHSSIRCSDAQPFNFPPISYMVLYAFTDPKKFLRSNSYLYWYSFQYFISGLQAVCTPALSL